MRARLEHNLHDIELEEVLEKGLRTVQQQISNSARLKSQAMIDLAERWKQIHGEQMEMMLSRIEEVLGGDA